ncbi:uncharacterized protein TNCV_915381 [Trichonephila clavipes]|nr:uncharacterized protein TNCV_915381 [Trichonephila clavipes]
MTFCAPLHIKLGFMKKFVKSMKKDREAFQYLRSKFPRLSDAVIEEGIFVDPQIRKIMKDPALHQILKEKEKAHTAWEAFKSVVRGFLGRKKDENYSQLNCRAVTDEQGEKYHQDSLAMERICQGRWEESMLPGYCWTVLRDTSTHKMQSERKCSQEIN